MCKVSHKVVDGIEVFCVGAAQIKQMLSDTFGGINAAGVRYGKGRWIVVGCKTMFGGYTYESRLVFWDGVRTCKEAIRQAKHMQDVWTLCDFDFDGVKESFVYDYEVWHVVDDALLWDEWDKAADLASLSIAKVEDDAVIFLEHAIKDIVKREKVQRREMCERYLANKNLREDWRDEMDYDGGWRVYQRIGDAESLVAKVTRSDVYEPNRLYGGQTKRYVYRIWCDGTVLATMLMYPIEAARYLLCREEFDDLYVTWSGVTDFDGTDPYLWVADKYGKELKYPPFGLCDVILQRF